MSSKAIRLARSAIHRQQNLCRQRKVWTSDQPSATHAEEAARWALCTAPSVPASAKADSRPLTHPPLLTRNPTAPRNGIKSGERNRWVDARSANGISPGTDSSSSKPQQPARTHPKASKRDSPFWMLHHVRRHSCNSDSSDAEIWPKP